MRGIITCGKCDKSFWYYFLAYFLIYVLTFSCYPKFSENKSEDNKKFGLTRSSRTYFGQLLMFFYELIYKKISQIFYHILA